MRVDRNIRTDAADVFLQALLFRCERLCLLGVTRSELVSDGDFLFVRESREMHGKARKVALSVGGHVQDGVGGNGSGFLAALAPVEASECKAKDQKENDEYNGALHRYW